MKKFIDNIIAYILFPVVVFVVSGCATVRDELAEFRAEYTARVDEKCEGDISETRAALCASLRERIANLQSLTDSEIDALEREVIEALTDDAE